MSRRGGWITVAQAANEFPLSESAIRHHIEDRLLPVHRVGRRVFIARDDLDGFLEAGRQEAARQRRRYAAQS